jgi:hypothetical protein
MSASMSDIRYQASGIRYQVSGIGHQTFLIPDA